MRMSPSTLFKGEAFMNHLLFVAPGIVTRGTRVWRGSLGDNPVAIKYSWRSSTRPPEASLYQLAASHDVIGLATLVAYDSYEDIATTVRFNHGLASSPLVDIHVKSHNRQLTRLILTLSGRAISDENLSPSQVAKGLLQGWSVMRRCTLMEECCIEICRRIISYTQANPKLQSTNGS
ncbi:hypothetical protein L211DRAFT_100523 [Terfezia boudieri ATCC MYA-4762]|uniref:Fungal-type protein kinase domain-containing protein n=1 Tax=Terfezia boudieri ATCC MYA-4762 TaxID=1051890 RepID=A0A3N4L5Z6_9PEZI|nr:hypothetical protein L211DRAFT_100523 [Terfezia boudieri ATCC MYA-4762]